MPLSTPERLNRHLESMEASVHDITLGTLVEDEPVACVDGRTDHEVAGAPGGNAGLFLSMIAALEETTGRDLASDDVRRLFTEYLDAFGAFYMHTDSRTVDALFHTAGVEASDSYAAILSPTADQRTALEAHVTAPEHVGCGHLRLMIEHPGPYGVRRAVVESFLADYFRRLWDGDGRIVFEVLHGDHQEQAVVAWHTTGNCLHRSVPSFNDRQMFVHHATVVAFMEMHHNLFLLTHDWLTAEQTPAFQQAHREVDQRHLDETLSRLAPDLPRYDVQWTGDHTEFLEDE